MTDSDTQAETWAPIPDFAIRYQAHPDGLIRNRNGLIMSSHPSGSNYMQLNLVPDEGGKPRTVQVHICVLRTFRGECPPGMEACHLNHNQHDNRLVNLAWGPIPDNRRAPSPARPARQPKTPAPCILCGAPVTKGGRRCHACVKKIGWDGAELARGGMRLEDVNDEVGYGNAIYLHALMVRHGGWGHCQPCTCAQDTPQMPADLVSPTVTVPRRRSWLRRPFAKRAGDGQ